MYKRFTKISILALASAISVLSCRNIEPDSTIAQDEQNNSSFPSENGKINIQVNLIGTAFDSQKGSYGLDDTSTQTIAYELSPGNSIIAELTPAISAFSDTVKGENLPKDATYRVFAFNQKDGIFVDYKDFTVGEEKPGSLTLNSKENYTIIAYAESSMRLPIIKEGSIKTIDDLKTQYSSPDIMYFKLEDYSPSKQGNIINITLKHLNSNLSVNVGQIMYESYVKNVSIGPNHYTGTIDLKTGSIQTRMTTSETKITDLKYNLPEGKIISGLVGINSTEEVTFNAEIKQNNYFRKIKLPLKLKPGIKYNLLLKLKYNCGAFVSKELWKEFMCHNLGANYDTHPFNKISDLYGNKYQWGVKIPSSTHEEDVKNVSKNIEQIDTESNAWRDDFKTENDPCPSGYRVPTPSDFQGLIDYNEYTLLATWTDKKNYTMKFGEDLILPLAGFRTYKDSPLNLNTQGNYWTSHALEKNSDKTKAKTLNIRLEGENYKASVLSAYPYSLSIRCIAEKGNTSIGQGIPGTSWDGEEDIEVDIDKIINEKK